jgi:hypothetical protein
MKFKLVLIGADRNPEILGYVFLYNDLERFPADVNRGGFPRVQFSDSGFMLMKEVGMDGSRAFTGSS